MENKDTKNPWRGLESYQEGEILYGRSREKRELSQCILNYTGTLLYGKSGVGKTSIINAGIMPIARHNGYLPVPIRLQHKEGEKGYLQQIIDALERELIPQIDEEKEDTTELKKRIQEVVTRVDDAKETVYEYFHRHTFYDENGERLSLLFIVDQFEEIFTLQEDESKRRNFFDEMAGFINDIMPDNMWQRLEQCLLKKVSGQNSANKDALVLNIDDEALADIPEYVHDNNIHFLFTIREDFLSEFEYYTAKIPSFKTNRYGLRSINEEQAAEIIMYPISGFVDKTVAKLIIEKVAGRNDFELDGIPEISVDSAILSLFMYRLYEASGRKENKSAIITADLVNSKSENIIRDFYEDAVAGIEGSIDYLESQLLTGSGRRDNIPYLDAINSGIITKKEIDRLVNEKKILRKFNYAGELRLELVHDRLCEVVLEHKQKRVEEWRAEERDNRLFLRLFISTVSFFTFIGIFLWLWHINDGTKSGNELRYYDYFVVKNGLPCGIDLKYPMPVKYIIEKKIHNQVSDSIIYKNVVIHVECDTVCVKVVDNRGNQTCNLLIESPLVRLSEICGKDSDSCAARFANLQIKTSKWVFRNMTFTTSKKAGDDEYEISRQLVFEDAYNLNDSLLYSVCCRYDSKLFDYSKHEYYYGKRYGYMGDLYAWARFFDGHRKPMKVRDNGADRMQIKEDARGYRTSYFFYNANYDPCLDGAGEYGYDYTLDENGAVLKINGEQRFRRVYISDEALINEIVEEALQ